MEFTARPVAPYLVPIDEFTPVGGASRHLGEVHAEVVATAGAREVAPVAVGQFGATSDTAADRPGADTVTDAPDSPAPGSSTPVSPRLLELLALAEQEPELAVVRTYLSDPEPAVRSTAVTVLTETAPPGTGPVLAKALADHDPGVRAAAAASLRELVETLPPEPALREGLAVALAESDPVVRAAALDVLRALRLGDTALFAGALTDSDIAVRIEAVRALVSVDAAVELAHAATTDPSREVRVTIAKALATVSAERPLDVVLDALARLTEDPDALVRGAAYAALGTTGCPAPRHPCRRRPVGRRLAGQVGCRDGTVRRRSRRGRPRPRQGPGRPERRRPQGRRPRPDPAHEQRRRARGPGHGHDGLGRGRQGVCGAGLVR